eukprot:6196055-Pleurochrysis_carterae.AAC.2
MVIGALAARAYLRRYSIIANNRTDHSIIRAVTTSGYLRQHFFQSCIWNCETMLSMRVLFMRFHACRGVHATPLRSMLSRSLCCQDGRYWAVAPWASSCLDRSCRLSGLRNSTASHGVG